MKSGNSRRKLTDEEKIEIVSLYETGQYTRNGLARKFGAWPNSIKGILERRGVKIPDCQTRIIRKYTLNESYFDQIDTEEKAYFLGLLYADGCNHNAGSRVSITLQAEDVEILQKFNEAVGSNRPLHFVERAKETHKDLYVLTFNSKKMQTKLCSLGCTPRKSLTLKFPTEEQVPSRLIRHFIRGYFDGDGCVSVSPTKRKTQASFRGNIWFCEEIGKTLKEVLGITYSINQLKLDKPTVQMTINAPIVFLKWLYLDCNIYLDRKYKKVFNQG